MIKKLKKISDNFSTFLGFLGMTALLVFFICIENPLRYFLYALGIAVAVNFKDLRYLRINFRSVTRNYLTATGIIYLLIITVLSLSPFLSIQEFKASHWNWKPINASSVKALSFWDSGYRRMGNSYADIHYKYRFGGKSYKNKESEALKKYYPFWNGSKPDELVTEFSKSVSEKIEKKDFIVFCNPKQPQKSKFFLSTDLFYFQGSEFYNFITSFAMMTFSILGIISAIFIFSNRKK
jgi:hypothetical protein